jgi:cyanophycin synthetase
VFDEHPFKVILDYGHNPAAMSAMAGLADRLDVKGKRIVVVSVPGDRRDVDVVDAARMLAGHFDHFICKADDNRRKRGHDEIPLLFKAALISHGVAEDQISVIPNEEDAVAASLEMAQTGDLVIIFGDNSPRCWKQIIYFNAPDKDAPLATKPTSVVVPKPFEDLSDSDFSMVRDGRGVRLARDNVEDGD